MKFINTKIVFAAFTFILVLQSCSNNSDLTISKENNASIENKHNFSEITSENKEFKTLLLDTKNIVKLKRNTNSNDRKSAPSKAAENAIKNQMNELAISSMKMLKSYGIKYEDISQYVDSVNDPKIALMGMVFIAIQKECLKTNNQSTMQKTTRFKTKADETFSYGKIVDCASRTITGVSAADWATGKALGYFTLETALGIAGRCASRTLGVVAAAVAIADFGDCMGWYNLW